MYRQLAKDANVISEDAETGEAPGPKILVKHMLG